MEPSPNQIEKWHNDPSNWKWRLFYYNKEDARLIVDKKNPRMGLTLNFAHPKSYWFLLGMAAFFGFIIYMLTVNLKIT